ESVGARAVLGLICRNAGDHDRSTWNAWICCVNRRKGQRDRLVARWGAVTQVRRVVGGRRARGVAVGLAERGNLPTLVRPVVDPHVEGSRRGIVAEVDVLDVPPRDPSAVAGHGGPLAEAVSTGVYGDDLGGQVIGVGGVEVLLDVAREIDRSGPDSIGTQTSHHDDGKDQRTQAIANHDESPSTYG